MTCIDLPGNGPSLEDLVGAYTSDHERLLSWGFNLRGSAFEESEQRRIYCWAGRLTARQEAPVLAVVTPPGELKEAALQGSEWYFGILRAADLRQTDNPIEAVVNAAEYRRYRESVDCAYNFNNAIEGLVQIMPLRNGSAARLVEAR